MNVKPHTWAWMMSEKPSVHNDWVATYEVGYHDDNRAWHAEAATPSQEEAQYITDKMNEEMERETA